MTVTVDERDYARVLGYPWGTPLEGDVLERAESAIAWYGAHGIPRAYFHAGDGETVAVLTAGREAEEETDRLWREGLVDEAYFLDRYAAAVVRAMAAHLGPHRSPGCGRMPFEEQGRLFSRIAPQKPDIEMLPSGMLKPKNSLIAVFQGQPPAIADGVVSVSCRRCDLADCDFRRPRDSA